MGLSGGLAIFLLGMDRTVSGLVMSPSTGDVINGIATEVTTAVDIAVGAVGRGSPEATRQGIEMKPEITARTTGAIQYQLERLTADEPDRVRRIASSRTSSRTWKRICYYAKRAARVGVPKERPAEPLE